MKCPNCENILQDADFGSGLHRVAKCSNCNVQYRVDIEERTHEDLLKSTIYQLSTARTDLQLRADIDDLKSDHLLRNIVSEIEDLQEEIKESIDYPNP